MAASAAAFTVIKLAGAAYLLYLGVRALRRPSEAAPAASNRRSPGRVFADGLLVNVLNPKVALFFLAFLPQFVGDDTAARPQMLLLGIVFFGLALLLDLGYAIAGGALGGWPTGRRRVRDAQRYAVAAVYLGLGVFAGVSGAL